VEEEIERWVALRRLSWK